MSGVGWFDRGHIRYLGYGRLWFRSYSGSLWKSPKVSKGLCPACRRLAVARRSLTPAPRSGPPRRAIHGPARLNRRPAGLPAPHCLRSASGLLGQSDQDQKQKQKHSGLPAGLSVKSKSKNQSEKNLLFCGGGLAREKPESAAFIQNARVIVNDLREQARSHIWTVPALDFDFASNTQAGL
ncbi:hypothetical protein QF039_003817 [Pseudomonas sp. W2I6]|nr:hypothetical protein [Pseudomonas sp. W2I6]